MSKVFRTILSPITALFPEAPAAPEVKPPAEMPDPEDPRLRTQARRRAAKRSAESGRESTRLSDSTFSSTQL